MFCEFKTTLPICFKLYFALIKDGGVDFQLLTGATPDRYALNLMDSLFTDDEMREHLFFKSARSKSTGELLPQDCVKKLLGTLMLEIHVHVSLYKLNNF